MVILANKTVEKELSVREVEATVRRIIAQKAVSILPGDTPEILQRRVMEEAEWILLPEATEKVSKEILESRK